MSDTTIRTAGLKHMLYERRREIRGEVQSRIRDGRLDRSTEVCDDLELSDADMRGDVEFTLLQMRTETLIRIDEALVRLDAGTYGSCVACAGEIAERRLRALPFAARCQACETRREQEDRRAGQPSQRLVRFPLFTDVVHP
ncbi:MAG TPA: TraR/DksA C4-type zinc finger protein [Vicinamibacterales bacterium]|nr:TraR/DksA C4-type zinc finger protein [Vicinamibacterales bacterium]